MQYAAGHPQPCLIEGASWTLSRPAISACDPAAPEATSEAFMQRHIMVVMTNPAEGQDQAYNDWYDNTHLKDVLEIPGIKAATRYRLSEHQRADPPHPYSYLAIYEIETDDLPRVVSELKTRAGSELMPISPALAPARQTLIFEPRTGVRK